MGECFGLHIEPREEGAVRWVMLPGCTLCE